MSPRAEPTVEPAEMEPTVEPTSDENDVPTAEPTVEPTAERRPTSEPTAEPTTEPPTSRADFGAQRAAAEPTVGAAYGGADVRAFTTEPPTYEEPTADGGAGRASPRPSPAWTFGADE